MVAYYVFWLSEGSLELSLNWSLNSMRESLLRYLMKFLALCLVLQGLPPFRMRQIWMLRNVRSAQSKGWAVGVGWVFSAGRRGDHIGTG